MPHYKNGELAKVGDIVRGKGYNIKDANGELAEIVGTITHITEGTSVCNVQLIVPNNPLEGRELDTIAVTVNGVYYVALPGRLEYGQADHFEKVT